MNQQIVQNTFLSVSPPLKSCRKCHNMRYVQYDDNHAARCPVCCTHSKGYFQLKRHYGDNNGKYACIAGCGEIVDKVEGMG